MYTKKLAKSSNFFIWVYLSGSIPIVKESVQHSSYNSTQIEMRRKDFIIEAAKNIYFLMAVPLRGGGGVKDLPLTREQNFFGGLF